MPSLSEYWCFKSLWIHEAHRLGFCLSRSPDKDNASFLSNSHGAANGVVLVIWDYAACSPRVGQEIKGFHAQTSAGHLAFSGPEPRVCGGSVLPRRPSASETTRNRIMSLFSGVGFTAHDISDVSCSVSVLGADLGGAKPVCTQIAAHTLGSQLRHLLVDVGVSVSEQQVVFRSTLLRPRSFAWGCRSPDRCKRMCEIGTCLLRRTLWELGCSSPCLRIQPPSFMRCLPES